MQEKKIKANRLKSEIENQEEEYIQPYPPYMYLYLVVIILGWINIGMIILSAFVLMGVAFGSIPVENMGSSDLEKLVKFGLEYNLWLWLLVPSLLSIWQFIQWKKVKKNDSLSQ